MSHSNHLGRGLVASVAAALLVSALPLAAQSKPSYPANRFSHQQQRINQGLKSGQMTKGEYNRAESHLKSVEQQRKEYVANHGKMSQTERAKLNRELNSNSNRVYFTKHNDLTQKGTNAPRHEDIPKITAARGTTGYVNDRMTRQMDRIRNGVASGQITRGEYNTDVQRLRDIQSQEHAWLKAQNGQLTQGQMDQLNRQLNGELEHINRTKHNQFDQPGT